MLDDGKGALTHLLLAGVAADGFFSFASASGCRVVVEQSASGTKTFGPNYFDAEKPNLLLLHVQICTRGLALE